MKKSLIFLGAVILLFGMAGSASAITFTHDKIIGEWLGGAGQPNSGTYSWSHPTPIDFSVPPDIVQSARLDIWAYCVNGNNDTVDVHGVMNATLTNSFFIFPGLTLDIGSVFASWPAGGNLDVSLAYTEKPWWNGLYLAGSRFTLNYTDGAAPIPEPGTIALLGIGLVGLVGAGVRRKMKKDVS